MSHLRLFASEELVLALRSRWTQIFAVVFGLLACGVSGAGYVLSGGHGVQDFARTAVSLVQLVLLLVPLTALMIGVLSLAPERGAAELVFSQPVARSTILLGKLLGLFQALAAAQAVGFGAAGALVYGQSGSEGLGEWVLRHIIPDPLSLSYVGRQDTAVTAEQGSSLRAGGERHNEHRLHVLREPQRRP